MGAFGKKTESRSKGGCWYGKAAICLLGIQWKAFRKMMEAKGGSSRAKWTQKRKRSGSYNIREEQERERER